MRLPPAVVPLLEALQRNPQVARGTPLEIWRAPDHRTWVAAFIELGLALHASDLPEEGLPAGYVLAAFLFHWEAACQCEGWAAFDNVGADIERVIPAYRAVGLDGEADALVRARAEWLRSRDPDATSSAYARVRHAHTVDLDRLEHIVCHLIDHADALFYLVDEDPASRPGDAAQRFPNESGRCAD